MTTTSQCSSFTVWETVLIEYNIEAQSNKNLHDISPGKATLKFPNMFNVVKIIPPLCAKSSYILRYLTKLSVSCWTTQHKKFFRFSDMSSCPLTNLPFNLLDLTCSLIDEWTCLVLTVRDIKSFMGLIQFFVFCAYKTVTSAAMCKLSKHN